MPTEIAFTQALNDYITAQIELRMSNEASIAEQMVRLHGERISHKRAASLLNVTTQTVANMCRDGRLSGDSSGVWVRSIATLMEKQRKKQQHKPNKPETKRTAAFQPLVP